MDITIDALRSVNLLHDLNPDELERIRSIGATRTLPRRTTIFREGEEVTSIYFIIYGLIRTHKTDEKGNEQILSLLKTGDMFPHTGQFGSTPYSTTATTVINTELFALPISSFEQILAGSPSIAFKMMAVKASEIRELQNKLQGFSSRNLEDRGISFFTRLLSSLCKEGLLTVNRKDFLIHNLQALRERVMC